MNTPPLRVLVSDHPLVEVGVFVARYPSALAEHETPAELAAGFDLEFDAPVPKSDEAVRKAIRDLLRVGGFKPSGRSKPASEFLIRAAGRSELGSINLAVDLCNVVSLHSGLPVSVVDLDRVVAPLRIAVAEPEASYVFNPAGQTIALGGLLCLHDAEGPCANPVKDSQRTKTHAGTRSTLSIVWGSRTLRDRLAATFGWYRELHGQLGIASEVVEVV